MKDNLLAIDVPASCFDVKADFPTMPSDDVVSEIEAHIRSGTPPHLWRGHTHTKPPAMAEPVYLAQYETPRPAKDRSNWAPCPCCSPHSRKYYKGIVAWFPGEGVIRLMGSVCFGHLNPEVHKKAKAALDARTADRRNIEYLIRNAGLAPVLAKLAEEYQKPADSLDRLTQALKYTCNDAKVALWPNLQDGKLYVVEGDNRRVYATIQGYEVANPSRRLFCPDLESVVERVKQIPSASVVKSLTADERRKAAHTLGKAYDDLRRLGENIRAAQKFVSATTLATLRTWSTRDDCAADIHIGGRNDMLLVGRRDGKYHPIKLYPEIRLSLSFLPTLSVERVIDAA